jgi:hypothetical protein
MAAESKPKVLIIDDHSAGGYLEAAAAVARHTGFEPQTFECLPSAYEHMIGDVDALVASFGIMRSGRKARGARIAEQLLEKANELDIATAFMADRHGSAQYGLNGRDVYIPLRPEAMVAQTLNNWMRAITEPAYIPRPVEEVAAVQEQALAAA